MMFSAALLPVTTMAAGKVYYASPSGSGDGSSYTKPCSFQTGISKISSGDTLYLLGGQYDLSTRIDVASKKSGTAEKRTVIAGYPGEKAILDYRKQPYANEVTGSNNIGLCLKGGGEYYHLKDFTIRYAGKNGLLNNANYCLIENLEVYGCGDSGIQHKDGGGNVIKNFMAKTLTDLPTSNTPTTIRTPTSVAVRGRMAMMVGTFSNVGEIR